MFKTTCVILIQDRFLIVQSLKISKWPPRAQRGTRTSPSEVLALLPQWDYMSKAPWTAMDIHIGGWRVPFSARTIIVGQLLSDGV